MPFTTPTASSARGVGSGALVVQAFVAGSYASTDAVRPWAPSPPTTYSWPSSTPLPANVRRVGIGAFTVQQLVVHVISNAALDTASSPAADATSVYPLPDKSMRRSGKV